MENEKNNGYCHCCSTKTVFEITGPWLRDQYLCENCHSIPRQRALSYILDRFILNWKSLAIHESSPSNDFIKRYSADYSSSQYFTDSINGEFINGIRCENLEKLTFSDNTFDIFITQDVFEHIFNPDIAVKEIMRVLKPGGIHIFTTPKHKKVTKSYARAKLKKSGKIQHLYEEQYHGNPIGDGHSLVTWDYGDDFEFLLHKWSGYPTTTYITRDRSLGIDGEYLEVFITRKIPI
jgi:SAM-dependent methyltransferase